jgi:DNA-binding NtrC family response regulator
VTGKIWIVEDDAEMAELLRGQLARRGYQALALSTASAALERLASDDADAVVTDVRMRGIDGIQLCHQLHDRRPDIPVVVITAFGSLDTAVAAIRAGAFDFLAKPFEIEELAFRLERALQHRRLADEVKRLRAGQEAPVDELTGDSEAMRRLRDLVARMAPHDSPVLILGETGAGKERVARALHRLGRRPQGPFVALNCAALPEHLLESELFGHARGAFTDARSARAGLLVHANGGTLFLDEVGELPLSLQPKLLRALQEQRVRPVGGEQEVAFDARVIAATNRDIDAAVEEGRFREDLFFRLDVLRIDVPPLRARGSDALVLARQFLAERAARAAKPVKGLSHAAAEKLLRYPWPGNVRELQNCIERAVALTQHEQILPDDLPERIRDYGGTHVVVASDDPAELVPLEVVERRYIARVLESVGGNKTVAAHILGLDRKTLYRKLRQGD